MAYATQQAAKQAVEVRRERARAYDAHESEDGSSSSSDDEGFGPCFSRRRQSSATQGQSSAGMAMPASHASQLDRAVGWVKAALTGASVIAAAIVLAPVVAPVAASFMAGLALSAGFIVGIAAVAAGVSAFAYLFRDRLRRFLTKKAVEAALRPILAVENALVAGVRWAGNRIVQAASFLC